jgi:hypothetical protein
MDASDVTGRYRHFKGGRYEVIGIARHSETEEELVVYTSESGDWWVRPSEMFFGTTTVDGRQVERFTRVSD